MRLLNRMDRVLLTSFFLFIFVSKYLVASTLETNLTRCPFTSDIKNEILLPSVVHDSKGNPVAGEPIYVSVWFVNGRGNVKYVGVSEVAGDTDNSIKIARSFAFESLNKSQYLALCDLYVALRFDNKQRESVNISGPSGGAGFYIIIKAELAGKKLRDDAAITGTLDEDLHIGAVGNYYEKASYLTKNISYFVTPKLSIMDQLLLYKYIKSNQSLHLVEVDNIEDAYKFFVKEKEIQPKISLSIDHQILNTSLFSNISDKYAGIDEFILMVKDEISSLRQKIKDVNFSNELKEYFISRLNNIETIYSYGYYYTAGNDLFLLETEFMMAQTATTGDMLSYLATIVGRTEVCIELTSKTGLLNQDLETLDKYVGVAVRLFWAKKNLNNLNISNNRENNIQAARDIGYAYGWCEYSRNLLNKINSVQKQKLQTLNSGVMVLNQSSLSLITKKLLEIYNSFNDTWNYEIKKYYDYAVEAYKNGDNLAALYNLYFAKSISDYLQNSSSDKIGRVLDNLISYNYKSFWAKVYATQMHYLHATKDNGSALRLGLIALNMDELSEILNSYAKYTEYDIGSNVAEQIVVGEICGPKDEFKCISQSQAFFYVMISSILTFVVSYFLFKAFISPERQKHHHQTFSKKVQTSLKNDFRRSTKHMQKK